MTSLFSQKLSISIFYPLLITMCAGDLTNFFSFHFLTLSGFLKALGEKQCNVWDDAEKYKDKRF